VGAVRAELLVDERRALVQRGLDVGDHRQRLVLDEHLLAGVHRGVAVLGQHDGHRISHVLDRAAGQGPVLGVVDLHPVRRPGHRQGRGEVGQVVAREDRHHVVALERRGRVDGHDARMRLRGADEGGVEHADDRQVVDVGGLARDQPRVLLAAQGAPDVARGGGAVVHERHAVTSGRAGAEPMTWAASWTAATMLW
jgi:hypothetical protein